MHYSPFSRKSYLPCSLRSRSKRSWENNKKMGVFLFASSRLALIVIIPFWFGGCDSGIAGGDAALVCSNHAVAGTLRPLEVGNSWSFEVTDFFGEVLDTLRHEITSELSAARFDNNRAFVLKRFNLDTASSADMRIWVDSGDGQSMEGFIGDQDTVLVRFLKYPFPAKEGDTFYSYTWTRSTETGQLSIKDSTRYDVVGTNSIIDSPAGLFTTTVFKYYHQTQPDVSGNDIYLHFAPGYGLVARREWSRGISTSTPPEFQHMLIDYCLMSIQNN